MKDTSKKQISEKNVEIGIAFYYRQKDCLYSLFKVFKQHPAFKCSLMT